MLLLFNKALTQQNDIDIALINGGQPVENIQDATWVVKIERHGGTQCTGILISNQWVLTAAHCVTCNNDCENRILFPFDDTTPYNPSSFEVFYGSSIITNSNEDIIPSGNISDIYVHGLYDGYAGDDIALLKLSEPIEFTDNVKPIDYKTSCEPNADGAAVGMEAELYGWGRFDGSRTLPDTLQMGYATISSVTNSEISVVRREEGESSPCSGDSGGPLVIRKNGALFLVGVLSTGNAATCSSGTSGTYERVSHYAAFIDYYVDNECAPNLRSVDNVCYSQTTTITLSNPGSATTTWTSSNNVQIVSSNNSSATIRAINSLTSGNGWIRATLSNGVEFTESFDVGTPDIDGYKIYNTSYNGNYIELRNRVWNYLNIVRDSSIPEYYNIYPTPLAYKWDVTADNSLIRSNPNRWPRAAISPNHHNNGGVVVGIRAENECGCSPWKWQDYIVGGVGGSSTNGGAMEETED